MNCLLYLSRSDDVEVARIADVIRREIITDENASGLPRIAFLTRRAFWTFRAAWTLWTGWTSRGREYDLRDLVTGSDGFGHPSLDVHDFDLSLLNTDVRADDLDGDVLQAHYESSAPITKGPARIVRTEPSG